jgi:cytochrome c oxidase subunit 2
MDFPYGLPPDASADGHRIDSLIQISIVFIAVLFAFMVGWMLWACFAHGRKHKARHDHGTSRRAKLISLGFAAGVFVVVDGNLFVTSTRDMHDVFWNFDRAEAAPDVVRVEVNAHQWAWDFRHAGPDGVFATADDVVTLNELRVPQGSPVLLQIGAVDVIHSFYLPNFRVKIDAVPGSLSRAWFVGEVPGEYDIGCAQHCGTAHYKMKARLIVQPREEFEAWMAHAARVAERSYVESDSPGNWGWAWKKDL